MLSRRDVCFEVIFQNDYLSFVSPFQFYFLFIKGLFVRIDYMMAKHPKEVSAFNLGGVYLILQDKNVFF